MSKFLSNAVRDVIKMSTANQINDITSKGINHTSRLYSKDIQKGTINKV